jgi:hypothetical protein
LARYQIIPERSQLWADARSSLHPIRVKTSGLRGYVEASTAAGQPSLSTPTRVEIDAQILKSGNGLLDGELQRRLEVHKYGQVTGELTSATALGAASGRFRLRGALTLHGVARVIEADVWVRAVDSDTIEIEGEKVIDMRDYDLTPPKILLLRVHPEVHVRARLVAQLPREVAWR